MYCVNWQSRARKQISKIIDRTARIELEEAVDGLHFWPDCSQVKALTNHDYGYRLRAGRFRILFDVDTATRIITIQEVKKRDDRTY
ncbi:MAG: type II toxin-antitoxin system RelE/ParE family toxin [Pseudomonadales bacterium]|nr:type II toxin-antitoxin system RelE/ParE family toxin [Pseudomonadales bacterium]